LPSLTSIKPSCSKRLMDRLNVDAVNIGMRRLIVFDEHGNQSSAPAFAFLSAWRSRSRQRAASFFRLAGSLFDGAGS
jgi:hypothetical protein